MIADKLRLIFFKTEAIKYLDWLLILDFAFEFKWWITKFKFSVIITLFANIFKFTSIVLCRFGFNMLIVNFLCWWGGVQRGKQKCCNKITCGGFWLVLLPIFCVLASESVLKLWCFCDKSFCIINYYMQKLIKSHSHKMDPIAIWH